jgi:hypothetical protein
MFDGKTRTGTIIAAVGMAIYQTVDLCPVDMWVPWIKWMGAILSILGGGTAMYGLANKVDKVINTQKTLIPVINNLAQPSCPPPLDPPVAVTPSPVGVPLTEERFLALLKEARKAKITPTITPAK